MLSIRTKVLIGLLALMLLAVGTLVQVSTAVVQSALLEEHNKSALAILHVVQTVFPDIADIRGPLAQQRLASIAQGSPEVTRLAIVSPIDGRWHVVASSREDDLLRPIELGVSPEALREPVAVPVPGSENTAHYFLAPLPRTGLPGAAVVVETYTGSIQRIVDDISGRLVQVALLGIVVLVGLVFWGTEVLLLFPIRRLHWLAGELKRGRLQVRSGIRRQDEIGHLASALDEMAIALERAARENERLYKDLEQRWEVASRDSNHRYLHLRLDEELARSARQGSPLSLLFLDIDHFKTLGVGPQGHRRRGRCRLSSRVVSTAAAGRYPFTGHGRRCSR